MCCYSQIQGTRSKKDGELWDKSVLYFQQESGPCRLDWRISIFSNVENVVPYFQQESGPCPLDWRKTIHLKVVLAISNIIIYVKIVGKIPNQHLSVRLFFNPRDKLQILVESTGQFGPVVLELVPWIRE